jgi:hypothetical protein
MATCVFVEDDADHLLPEWPASANHLSILLEHTQDLGSHRGRYLVAFLAPELATDHLRPGSGILIMEGPKVVGRARVDAVL